MTQLRWLRDVPCTTGEQAFGGESEAAADRCDCTTAAHAAEAKRAERVPTTEAEEKVGAGLFGAGPPDDLGDRHPDRGMQMPPPGRELALHRDQSHTRT